MSSCVKRSFHLALVVLFFACGPVWAGGDPGKEGKDALQNATNNHEFIAALIFLYNQGKQQPPPQESLPPPDKKNNEGPPQEG